MVSGLFHLSGVPFQSTHPSGVRHAVLHASPPNVNHFNPRTPVGCDPVALNLVAMVGIFQSTHPSGVRPGDFTVWLFKAGVFQSTHPSGVRPCRAPTPDPRSRNFNPRTPVGCDHIWGHMRDQLILFQSTHPSGVRPTRRRWARHILHISIHAPQWGATSPGAIVVAMSEFQSTHPSGVRLSLAHRTGAIQNISIHAPQWGATVAHAQVHDGLVISIHAPQWGATFGEQDHGPEQDISIHAPQWGATKSTVIPPMRTRFQSTHPSGVRPQLRFAISRLRQFQSTHPSGVRHRQDYPFAYSIGISIHAPQWGATVRPAHSPQGRSISIHAPQWGATLFSTMIRAPLKFQSTHPSGVRLSTRI